MNPKAITIKSAEQKMKEISKEIEKRMFPNVKEKMGGNWNDFKYALAWTMQEHRVNLDEILDMIGEKSFEIVTLHEKLQQEYPERKESIYTIILSSYVSGFLHGIDPKLLIAIAQKESSLRVDIRDSRAGAVGCFQNVPNKCSLIDLFNPDSRHRGVQTRALKRIIKTFEGKELLEFVRFKDLRAKKVGKKYEVPEYYAGLLRNPLYSAVWAARTLLLKTGYKDVKVKRPEDMIYQKKMEAWIARYNGEGAGAKKYAEDVFFDFNRLHSVIALKRMGTPERVAKE